MELLQRERSAAHAKTTGSCGVCLHFHGCACVWRAYMADEVNLAFAIVRTDRRGNAVYRCDCAFRRSPLSIARGVRHGGAVCLADHCAHRTTFTLNVGLASCGLVSEQGGGWEACRTAIRARWIAAMQSAWSHAKTSCWVFLS